MVRLLEVVEILRRLSAPGYRQQEEAWQMVAILREWVPLSLRRLLLAESPTFMPVRWEEPSVQYYIEMYVRVMAPPDSHLGRHGDEVGDLVYSGVLNPDAKARIRNRTMGEAEYERIRGQMLRPSMEKLSANIRSLTRVSRDLTPQIITKHLDLLQPPMLAIESNLSEKTVEKYKKRGYSGSQIVELGNAIKNSPRTTSPVVEELIRLEVEDWEELIEIAENARCTIKLVIDIVRQSGSGDTEGIVGLLDEAAPYVYNYAHGQKRAYSRGWWIIFQIYKGHGQYDVARTLDLFARRYPDLDVPRDIDIDIAVDDD